MIFLEQLVARHVGEIDDVGITFAPRGRHLIQATPAAAATLRAALRCALLGDVAPGFGRRDGALVGASIVAGGAGYVIERRIGGDGRLSTSLARRGASGLVPISGAERIERELDQLLGADGEAFAALIWPPRNLEPLTIRLRDIVSAWLGSRRMNLLAASVEVSQDLEEAERVASLHVALAKAAEAHAAAAAEVRRLEFARKRDRAARAVHQLEEAELLIAEAEAERLRMATLAAGLERQVEQAERVLTLAYLLDHRDAAGQRAQAAQTRRTSNEAQLDELRDLRTGLTTSEQLLATLERGRAAFRRADDAAVAAEKARRSSAAVGEDMAALERARQELSSSRSKAERLAAEAERARTLSDRVNEDSHLPAAHRLWREWLHHAPEAEDDVQAAKDEAAALHQQVDALEAAVRTQARDAQVRAGWRRTATGGALAGLAAGVLGLLAFAPLTPLGLSVGLAGTLAGIWLTLADRGNAEAADQLERELDFVARELQQVEHRLLAAEQAKQARDRVESELVALELEIPADAQRAKILRDSAAVRLRQMVDGDHRRDSAELQSTAATTAEAAADAARNVRRLEARAATLSRHDPEHQLIAAATERRSQLAKAADASRVAERLATELDIGASREAIEESRRETLRQVQQLQRRLRSGADVELQRQVAIRDETRANDELAALDTQIAHHRSTAFDDRRQRPRAVQLARLAATVAELGSERAHAVARAAGLRGRTVQAASRRHATDLAAALRALDVEVDADTTTAEARVAIPDLDAEPVDAEEIRRLLRQARDVVRRTETRVQTLELRVGVERTDIDHADAQARLDQAVRARRTREIGHTIVTGALDAVMDSLPAAIERELRIILPAASAGRFWDARIREGLCLEMWDAAAGAWRVPQDLDDESRERVERALALAFASAGPPLDATDLPAFLWLEQSAIDRDGAILQALVAAADLGAAGQRYPQVIATGRSLVANLGRFDRVTRLSGRHTDGPVQTVAGIREAG